MATIALTKQAEAKDPLGWLNLAANDVGEALYLPRGGGQVTIHAKGTFGGTITMQGTVNGTDWFTLLTSPGGGQVTFAAESYAEVSTAVLAVRPSAGAGVTATNVYIRVV